MLPFRCRGGGCSFLACVCVCVCVCVWTSECLGTVASHAGSWNVRNDLTLHAPLSPGHCIVQIAGRARQSTVQPCETAMVRQQLLPKGQRTNFLRALGGIWSAEGLRGCYRGIEAALLREMSYSTLRFGLYEPLRDAMHDTPAANAATPLGPDYAGAVRVAKRAFAGCAAGGIASAIASPTDLLKIRAQKDTRLPVPSLLSYVRAIAGQPGGPVAPFYEGVSATISRAVVLGATKMVTYNELKDFLKRNPGAEDPARRPAGWQLLVPGSYGWPETQDWRAFGHASPPTGPQKAGLLFLCSTAAGLAITITTSPITNARTHMMASPGAHSSLGQALLHVGKTYGVRGYFRGFAAQWARFGPYATVQVRAPQPPAETSPHGWPPLVPTNPRTPTPNCFCKYYCYFAIFALPARICVCLTAASYHLANLVRACPVLLLGAAPSHEWSPGDLRAALRSKGQRPIKVTDTEVGPWGLEEDRALWATASGWLVKSRIKPYEEWVVIWFDGEGREQVPGGQEI